jgi:hypothetical protein
MGIFFPHAELILHEGVIMNEIVQESNSKRNKTILFIIIGLVGLCLITLCAGVFAARKYAPYIFNLDPDQGKTSAHLITDYDLPEDFHEAAGMKIIGMDMTMIINTEQTEIIWLLQNPWGKLDDSRSTLTSITRNLYKEDPVSWQKQGERDFVLRGEETVIDIFSGESQLGVKYLAWVGPFAGKNGDAKVVFIAPDEEWDEDTVVDFFGSLR